MIKLYYHMTSGGAEYLCTKCLLQTKGEKWLKSVTRDGYDWRQGADEGDLSTSIFRLDTGELLRTPEEIVMMMTDENGVLR